MPLTIFHDDFQSEDASHVGTTPTTDDLDPQVDAGDTAGAWSIREGSNSNTNSLPTGIQVLNDNPIASGTAGTNNYLRVYRDSSASAVGKAYITAASPSWVLADTTNRVVQLDVKVFQPAASGGSDTTSGDGYLNIQFGSAAPQTNPFNTGWTSFRTVWATLSTGLDPDPSTVNVDLPDDQWNTVRIIANFSLADEQMGLAAQKYTVSVNGGTAVTGSFNTAQNQLRSILFMEGNNFNIDYIDDLQLQILNPFLYGDYNGNGVVDSADYVLWRKGVAPLLNEAPGVTPGTTTDEDYVAWRERFGNAAAGSGTNLGGSSVPEPAAALLVLGTALFGGTRRLRPFISH